MLLAVASVTFVLALKREASVSVILIVKASPVWEYRTVASRMIFSSPSPREKFQTSSGCERRPSSSYIDSVGRLLIFAISSGSDICSRASMHTGFRSIQAFRNGL